MFPAMRNIASMLERMAYLHRQAEAFREFSETSKGTGLRDQLADLARRCDEIATNIERNLPIHERCD